MAEKQPVRPLQWVHVIVQVAVAAICAYWFWRVPLPNKAVLVLTGVTVVLALLDVSKLHKAVYLLLVLSLLFIENRAINSDHATQVRDQQVRTAEERAKFKAIADELTASMRESEAQYNSTMRGLADSVKSVTGGDSYCYISFSERPGNFAYLFWTQKGRYPLRDVKIRLVDQSELRARIHAARSLEEALKAGAAYYSIPDAPVGSGGVLGRYPLTRKDQSFLISFSALNGFWSQVVRRR